MNNGENWTEETFALAEKTLMHRFRDKELLLTCFTHKSYANAFGGEHNERLEFLGDAVLGLAVTEQLFGRRSEDEGKLTERRKGYVSQSALEHAEKKAGLMRFLRYSGGEHNVGGKTASNLVEAVVAGLYLDGGMEAVGTFLDRYLVFTDTENYKTMLQEYVQECVKDTPCYETRATDGGFSCKVRALGRSAKGTGASKRAAETAAAKELLRILTEREKH